MTEMPTNPKRWNVGLIGYGEVGRILAEDLCKQNVRVMAYDLEHGRRRSEEVREVAETVREAGLTPWSAQGTAGFARSPDWRTEADRILAEIKSKT